MVYYPARIDNNTTLPPFSDTQPITAGAIDRLRLTIIAVQSELGVKPSATHSTVRARLDALETSLNNLQIISLAKDLDGTLFLPKVVGLQGRPLSNVAPATGNVLSWNGITWEPAEAAGTEIPVIQVSGSFEEAFYYYAADIDAHYQVATLNIGSCNFKLPDTSVPGRKIQITWWDGLPNNGNTNHVYVLSVSGKKINGDSLYQLPDGYGSATFEYFTSYNDTEDGWRIVNNALAGIITLNNYTPATSGSVTALNIAPTDGSFTDDGSGQVTLNIEKGITVKTSSSPLSGHKTALNIQSTDGSFTDDGSGQATLNIKKGINIINNGILLSGLKTAINIPTASGSFTDDGSGQVTLNIASGGSTSNLPAGLMQFSGTVSPANFQGNMSNGAQPVSRGGSDGYRITYLIPYADVSVKINGFSVWATGAFIQNNLILNISLDVDRSLQSLSNVHIATVTYQYSDSSRTLGLGTVVWSNRNYVVSNLDMLSVNMVMGGTDAGSVNFSSITTVTATVALITV